MISSQQRKVMLFAIVWSAPNVLQIGRLAAPRSLAVKSGEIS